MDNTSHVVQPALVLPEFVFRGTSYGYPGSRQAISVPYTCTSANPIKAALFALHCKLHYYHTPVVYVARTANLPPDKIIHQRGPSAVAEEEIAWEIAPGTFYGLSEGYLTLDDLKAVLKAMDLYPVGAVTLTNLSERCEEVAPLDVKVIKSIYLKINENIKKP